MLEGKAMVEDTDMPEKMQILATSAASHALDMFDVSDCTLIAAHIKRNLMVDMDRDGNVLWVLNLDASLLTSRGPLFTSAWKV